MLLPLCGLIWSPNIFSLNQSGINKDKVKYRCPPLQNAVIVQAVYIWEAHKTRRGYRASGTSVFRWLTHWFIWLLINYEICSKISWEFLFFQQASPFSRYLAFGLTHDQRNALRIRRIHHVLVLSKFFSCVTLWHLNMGGERSPCWSVRALS